MIEAPLDRNNHPERIVEHDTVIWTGFPSALATLAFSYGGNNTYPRNKLTYIHVYIIIPFFDFLFFNIYMYIK